MEINMQEVEQRIYPCEGCGKMRTKAEGGTTFTVCDACWNKDKLVTAPHTTQGYNKVTCDHGPGDPHEVVCDLRVEVLRLRQSLSTRATPCHICGGVPSSEICSRCPPTCKMVGGKCSERVRAEKAEAERAEYLAALWLCAYETAWVRTPHEYNLVQPWPMEEGPPRLLIMCSDTFAWACADCEPCEYPRATEVFRIMQTEGWPGVVRWVQAQRQERGEMAEPIDPVHVRMSAIDAMRARAEAAEALAASKPDITPEMADYFLSAYANGCTATWAALRAHAAKANKGNQ